MAAGDTHGGYVWVLAGFTPTDAAWANLVTTLATSFAGVAHLVSANTTNAIQSILADPNPEAIRGIPLLRERVNSQALGELLLLGTKWPGKLDLMDPSSLSRYIKFLR
jgi:hypothetical protein